MRKQLLTLMTIVCLACFGLNVSAQSSDTLCVTPYNLQTFGVHSNSAELMWDSYEGSLAWGLKVSTTALSSPSTSTANVLDTLVYYKPYQVTGLTPSTSYYFYVSAMCADGSYTSWSTGGTFTTGCTPVSIPYNEGFEAGDLFNTCWTNTFVTFGDWTGQSPAASTYAPKYNQSYKSAGSRSMQLWGYRYNTGGVFRYTQAWAVSPELSTTDITTLQARFALKAGTANTYVHVGVMTDPNDYATFEELAVLRNTNTNFTNITIPLSGVEAVAPHYYLAFYVDGSEHTASFYYYVDALVVEDAPACPQAQVLATRRVEDNKAVITWLGKAPSWNVKVSTTALSDPATDVADVATAVTSGSPYTVNGLTPSTLYYVYVQPNCTDGGGTWTGPLTFATPQVAPTLPYLCDFENASEANNWVFANNTTNGWAVGTAINHGGTHALYISNDGGNTHGFTNTSTTTASWAYRTIKFAPGTYQIMFDWHGDCETSATTHYDYARAFLVPSHIVLEPNINAYNISSGNVPPGWKALDDLQPLKKNPGWDFCEFIHNETDTSVYNLVFFWRNDGSGGQDPVAIDNVQIHTYTCGTPKSVTFQNITTTSAQMVWTPTYLGETTWEIQVLLNDSIVKQQTINNFPTYNITGLQASTNYVVRFRSNCGGGDTGPWRTFDFSTACGEITYLPYIESFSYYGTGTGTFPSCWKKYSTGSAYINSSYDHSGDGGGPLYFTNNTVSTQIFNVPGKQMSDLQIEFWYYASTAGYQLEVGIMTDTTSAASFVPVDTFVNAEKSVWYKAVVLLENYTGANGAVAFRMPSGKYIYIDDFVVKEKDRCQNVLGITASNIITTEATIDWTCSNSVSSWNVVIGRNGFDPDTCTTIYTANAKTYTFTGLTPNTAYEAYVRSNCGTDGYGEWVKFNFTTMKLPAIAPFTCDFEADGEAGNWDFYASKANKWIVGTSTATDSTGHSLYISNNEADYNYAGDMSSGTYSYATRTIVFPEAGNYNISFDWKGMGGSNTSGTAIHFMRAFMCQNEVVINPSNANGISNATTTPAGWTALDNNVPLFNQADWTHFSVPFSVSQPDTLKIVLYWRTQYTVTAAQQGPGAVDNLSVQVMVGCVTPNDFTSSISRNNATVNWNASDDATYRVKLSQTAIDPTTAAGDVDTIVNTNAITFRGLSYETSYNVYVQALCTDDTTTWGSYSFTMPCEAIYSLYEDFDAGTTLPGCWTRMATQGSTLPSIYNLSSSYAHTGMNSLRLNCTAGYVATPPMEPAIEDMAVSFYVYQQNETSSGLFVVGVMSDPNDFETFVPIDTINPTARTVEQHTVSFANSPLTGHGNYVVFYREGSSTTYGYYLDDINVFESRSCATPVDVNASNLTTNGAYLTWASTGLTNNLLVTTEPVIPDSIDENDPAVVLYMEEIQANGYSLAQMLVSNTTYYVYVQADCNESRPSLWSKEYRFKTLCANTTVPYTEDFTMPTYGEGVPDCWIASSKCFGVLPAHNVSIEPYVAGTAANHYLDLPVYYKAQTTTRERIASQNYVVLPGFTTDLDMLQMTFDTKSTNANKYVVGYMTDAGDLSTFTVVDTVNTTTSWATKVVKFHKTHETTGFMAIMTDATVTLATTDFHIRNVVVDTVVIDTIRVSYTDTLCLGSAYTENGFNIAAGDLVAGINQFTRVNEDSIFTLVLSVFTPASGTENVTICDSQLPYTWNGQSLTVSGTYTYNGMTAAGCDSIVTLTLTVNQAYNTTETLTVCPTALPYTWNGQTLTTDGVYTFNGTTAEGCDSIVTLNFSVGQSMNETIDLAICDTDLPFAWNGQDLTAAGTYTFSTVASNGCDSVATLNLTVNNSYAGTETLDLLDTDLPYTWNGIDIEAAGEYTFNGSTAEGCDSVITLTVNVTVGLDYAENGLFTITPNPVERGGKVRIDANVEETAVVEIYTSNGKLVSRGEHQAKPIYVTMPEVGGLYMVRLTTETGRMMYGKVIVK